MHRNDFDIRRDIEAELQWDPSIDEKALGVIVNDGVVTLTGQVEHLSARLSAEDIAKRIKGVRAIANAIHVKLAVSGGRSDSDIATAAANTLRWHVATCSADIRPVVQDGWITLKGHVPFAFQKVAAEQVLRNLVGVRMIINELSVGGAISAAEVKQSILAAFRRLAIHESNDIEVLVDIPSVTLLGHVSNSREREDAGRAACAAPGVTQVENRLFVT